MSRSSDRLLLGQRLLLFVLVLVMVGSAVLLWQLSSGHGRGLQDGRGAGSEVAAAAATPLEAVEDAPPAPPPEERESLTESSTEASALDSDLHATFAPDACFGRTTVAGEPEPSVELGFYLESLGAREVRAPVARAKSDAEGRFRVPGLLAHRRYLVALRSPRVVSSFERVYPGEPLELELERAVPVTGVVKRARDGHPLADVSVGIARSHWDGTLRSEMLETRTDSEGHFTLFGASEGLTAFHLARPGHVPERREFQVTAASSTPFEILLADEDALEFLAVDLASGEPLVATELLASSVRVRTDEQGRLFLPRSASPEDGLRLSLSHPDDLQTEGRLPSASGGPLPRMPVARGARVRGRVLDAAGAPVADAQVRIIGGGRGNNVPGLPEGLRLSEPRRIVRSEADGRFVLTGCVPRSGEVRVRATHPLHPNGESRPFTLERLEQELEVEVRLELGASIAGRVTLEGEPVALDLHWSEEDNAGLARSNARGEFRLEGLVPGEVTLRARLPDEDEDEPRPEDRTVLVAAGETLELELALTRVGATIEGRVLDAGGQSVPEAFVMAYSADDEEGELSTPSTQSARDGSFRLWLPPGVARPFNVMASEGPRRVERTDVAPGTRGLELVLPELGRVALRVEDARTREPVNGYTLYWRASDEGRYERFSARNPRLSAGPDGVYLAELPLGRLDLVVCERARGYVPCFRDSVVVTRELGPEVRFALEAGVALELVLGGDPALRGQLRRSYLESEEQAALAPRGGDFYQQEVRGAQGLRIDASGVLRLKGMPGGLYKVERMPRELEVEPARFTLAAVATERVELTLRRQESPPEAQPGGGQR